jgi:hypothetical protein
VIVAGDFLQLPPIPDKHFLDLRTRVREAPPRGAPLVAATADLALWDPEAAAAAAAATEATEAGEESKGYKERQRAQSLTFLSRFYAFQCTA